MDVSMAPFPLTHRDCTVREIVLQSYIDVPSADDMHEELTVIYGIRRAEDCVD